VIATAFTPEQGRALAESGNPVFAEMAGIELHHLPTGHWPMFSRPADVVRACSLRSQARTTLSSRAQ